MDLVGQWHASEQKPLTDQRVPEFYRLGDTLAVSPGRIGQDIVCRVASVGQPELRGLVLQAEDEVVFAFGHIGVNEDGWGLLLRAERNAEVLLLQRIDSVAACEALETAALPRSSRRTRSPLREAALAALARQAREVPSAGEFRRRPRADDQDPSSSLGWFQAVPPVVETRNPSALVMDGFIPQPRRPWNLGPQQLVGRDFEERIRQLVDGPREDGWVLLAAGSAGRLDLVSGLESLLDQRGRGAARVDACAALLLLGRSECRGWILGLLSALDPLEPYQLQEVTPLVDRAMDALRYLYDHGLDFSREELLSLVPLVDHKWPQLRRAARDTLQNATGIEVRGGACRATRASCRLTARQAWQQWFEQNPAESTGPGSTVQAGLSLALTRGASDGMYRAVLRNHSDDPLEVRTVEGITRNISRNRDDGYEAGQHMCLTDTESNRKHCLMHCDCQALPNDHGRLRRAVIPAGESLTFPMTFPTALRPGQSVRLVFENDRCEEGLWCGRVTSNEIALSPTDLDEARR